MTRAITQVLPQVRVPFGVDVLADTAQQRLDRLTILPYIMPEVMS